MKNRIEELKKKIKILEEKTKIYSNSCAGLQKEELDSQEQNRMYLEMLKRELKNLEN